MSPAFVWVLLGAVAALPVIGFPLLYLLAQWFPPARQKRDEIVEGLKKLFPGHSVRRALKTKLETHAFPSDLKPTALQIHNMLVDYDRKVFARRWLRKIIDAPMDANDYQTIADRIFQDFFDEMCRTYDKRGATESIVSEPA